jgi:hypothetical protein
MAKVIQIPKVGPGGTPGNIAFPDSMNDNDIQKAAAGLHNNAAQQEIGAVLHFVSSQTQSSSTSDRLKKMAALAQILEQYPPLADLAIAGLRARGGR